MHPKKDIRVYNLPSVTIIVPDVISDSGRSNRAKKCNVLNSPNEPKRPKNYQISFQRQCFETIKSATNCNITKFLGELLENFVLLLLHVRLMVHRAGVKVIIIYNLVKTLIITHLKQKVSSANL